jgi:hypothetical protein
MAKREPGEPEASVRYFSHAGASVMVPSSTVTRPALVVHAC